MKRIYVAGKYSDDDIVKILRNIRRGQEIAVWLMTRGFAVFCPFLDYQLALVGNGFALTKEIFQSNSMAWVEAADALYILSGWENSGGTRREIERAGELGIPVFYKLGELLAWREKDAAHG